MEQRREGSRCKRWNKIDHFIPLTPVQRSSQPEPKEKTPQPNKARDVSPPMDAANASVSQTYDAQKDSEQVLQGGTEATSQVSQSNKQSANSDLLHGIPDLQPLTPSLTVNTTSASNQHQLASPTTGKPQDTPSTKSTGDQQCPANSTLPTVLELPMQCNICDRESPGKNFCQHCQNSQHKKEEKFKLGPKEDLPKFLSMNYKRGLHGELIVGCQHYTDCMEIPNLN